MEQTYVIENILAKNGMRTLRVNGFYLHSKYNPFFEAENFVLENFKPQHVHILFGYGTGIIVDAFLKKMSEEDSLIVIEPILSDLSIEDNRVTLIQYSDKNQLKNDISNSFTITNNVTICCSPNYDKICTEIYIDFLKVIKDKLAIDRVSENTINLMSEEWQRNYLYNLRHAIQDCSIAELKKCLTSPVVIVSGGPSLTKQIGTIKKYRNKLVLIASGSAINTLLAYSIEPDFVVSIDSQEVNYNHFKELKLSHTNFIYLMYSHYKIRESFTDNSFYFLGRGDESFKEHLEKTTKNEVIILPGGGSVAHFALSIATYMTTGPITLVGQDLGFIKAEGYYGDEVLTDYSFMAMKQSFEFLVKNDFSDRIIFNSTEGGIKIEGFEQIPFESFCEKYTNNKVKINYNINKNNNIDYEILIKNFSTELENLDKIENNLRKNMKLMSKNTLKTKFHKNILIEMDINDEKILNLQQKTSLNVIVDPINLHVIKHFSPTKNETPKQAYLRVYNQSKTLYTKYIDAVIKTRKYTKNLIKKLREDKENEKNG